MIEAYKNVGTLKPSLNFNADQEYIQFLGQDHIESSNGIKNGFYIFRKLI